MHTPWKCTPFLPPFSTTTTTTTIATAPHDDVVSMPKYSRSKEEREANEARIQQALAECRDGCSFKSAAIKWNVCRTTLSRCAKGKQTVKESHEHLQHLSKDQEASLVSWILHEEKAGRAPSRLEVTGFADAIVKAGGGDEPCGTRWVDAFLERHPQVTMRWSRRVEASRADCANQETIEAFLTRLESVIDTLSIKQGNITNMDETGLQQGRVNPSKVAGDALKKRTELKTSEDTTWASIIEAITADGHRLKPLVIFTGETIQAQWFPRTIADWAYEATPSGFSNADISVKWLQEIYLPETQPYRRGWRLLLLDGLTSHATFEFQYECWKNEVHLEYIPPHSSHILQPLDVVPFSVLKRTYRKQIKQFQSMDLSAPVQKRRFLTAYANASTAAFSASNIEAAYVRSGIWPLNKGKGTDNIVLRTEEAPSAEQPTRTPTPPLYNSYPKYYTPNRSLDLQRQLRKLQTGDKANHANDRTVRLLFGKAGRGLDRLTTKVATLEQQLERQQALINKLIPEPRSTVHKDDATSHFISRKQVWAKQKDLPRRRQRNIEKAIQRNIAAKRAAADGPKHQTRSSRRS